MQVREAVASRELLWNLTLRELRGRYKRTVLGFGWSLLNPLATMVIFTFVFAYVLKITPAPGDPSGLDVFALWLLCGVLPWNFFATGAGTSMGAMIAGANLVKKVYFPRELLVYATVGSLLITHLVEMGLLIVVLLAFGNMVLPWLPLLVVVVALLTVFVSGVGLLLAALNVYFRDLTHLWGIITMAWFYATPVVYPISLIHDRGSGTLDFIYGLNPMTRFVEATRALLYDLRMPTLATFGYLVVVSFATFAFGLWVFTRLSPRFAEEL
jgi:ABC-2 type transport system permease protein